jgi:hypothetical protein
MLSLMLLCFSGCSRPENQKDSQLSQAETLLNQGNFSGAITYLNGVLVNDPGDTDFEALLATAHLGNAGFELLPVVSALLGAQNFTDQNIWNEPTCDPSAADALSDLDVECALYRYVQLLPAADNPDFLAAQAIYRTYFPNPSQTSEDINFIAGVVEFSSALTRVKVLLNNDLVNQMNYGVTNDPTQFPYDVTIHHTKRLITEVNWAIQRFQNSYDTLSSFVGSFNGENVLTVGTRTLTFDGSLDTASFLRFVSGIIQDRSVVFDQSLSSLTTARMHALGQGILPLLAAADPQDVTLTNGTYSFSFQFTGFTSTILNTLADDIDKNVTVSLFELAYSNPPPIVQQFLTAGSQAWDSESGAPLEAYFAATNTPWLQFKAIADGWNQWLNEDMTLSTQGQILSQISTDSVSHQAKLGMQGPGIFSPANASTWITNDFSFIGYEINEMGPNASNSSATSILVPDQVTQAQSLIDQTNAWMTTYFYPISDWVTIQ